MTCRVALKKAKQQSQAIDQMLALESARAARHLAAEESRKDDGPFFITGGDGKTYEARYDLPLPSEIEEEEIKAALCGPYGRFFNEGTD